MPHRVLLTMPKFFDNEGYVRDFLRDRDCELIEHDRHGKLTEDGLIDLIGDAEALVPGLERVGARVFDAAPQLRVVSAQGVGYDHIDVEEATRRGIAVCICAGCNNHSVAELAFGMMLGLARRVPEADAAVRAGGWSRLVGTELWGATLGIVGLGRVGRSTALIGRGFGMRVLATDIAWDITFANQHDIDYVPLPRLLRESDFVSLHCPLTPQTRGLIGDAALARMKPGAILINTARGPIVDEAALVRALRERRIAGAGLDVFETEPRPNNPFIDLPNAILTPHLGGATRQATDRALELALLNITQVLQGQAPVCRVN